jgi:hypothetical protein
MSAGLSGVGNVAETVKTQAEALMASFAALFAMTEIISFFKDVAEAAYEEEKSLRGVAQAALITGEDMNLAKEEASKFTSALSIQTGVIKTDLLDAYGKVYLATGKVTEAQKEVTLAANLASVRHLDMATALRLVESAATGVPGRFDRIVGGVTEGTTAFEKHESMTRRLIGAYGDVSKVTDDAAAAVDRGRRRWDEFKDTVGGPVLGAIAKTKDALALLPRTLEIISDLAVVHFQSIGRSAEALWTFLGNLKNFQDPIASWKAFQAQRLANQVVTDGEIAKVYSSALRRQVLADQAATVESVKTLDFRGKQEAAVVAKALGTRKEMEDAYFLWLKAKLADMEQATAKAYKDGTDFIRQEQVKEVADFQKKELKKAEIENQSAKVSEEIAKKTLAMKKAAAKQEIQMAADVANSVLGFAGAAFGQTKEVQAAQSIISGILGYMKTVEMLGLPWGAIIGALSLAAGVMNAAKIESTTVTTTGVTGGSGFDDPANDQAAYQGGHKWAKDMIQQFSGGATSAGWAAGMGSGAGRSITNNNSTVINNNIGGGIIDSSHRESMKIMARRLAVVQQSDSQRIVARRS